MQPFDELAQTYVQLGLAMDQHEPGYVDSYYGPPEWREQAKSAGPRPLAELEQAVGELLAAIAAETLVDAQRRDHLLKEVFAMRTRLRSMQGEDLGLVKETEALFDVTPPYVDEGRFLQAHQALDEMLPGEGNLHERKQLWKKSAEIRLDVGDPNLSWLMEELRRRTSELFPLPQEQAFELTLVSEKPWGAYNAYLGGCRSRIDINTDLPSAVFNLPGLLAHEGYPGHHTELSIKEQLLTKGRGWQEFCIALTHVPASLLAEGIATRALEMLFPGKVLDDWMRDELYPRFGLDGRLAGRDQAIIRAWKALDFVAGNAAFLLCEQHAPEADVLAYFQRYGLSSEKEAQHGLGFLQYAGSYIFTYSLGGELLDALFAARGDERAWFKRLLTEAATPSQVRAWIAGEGSLANQTG